MLAALSVSAITEERASYGWVRRPWSSFTFFRFGLTVRQTCRHLHQVVAAGEFKEIHDLTTVGDQLHVWQFKLKVRRPHFGDLAGCVLLVADELTGFMEGCHVHAELQQLDAGRVLLERRPE